MLEIILFILLGILAGTITGLIPGIHTNLIAVFILASIPFLSYIPVLNLIVFLVAMALTHTFVDFIPSVYFGAPDEETSLSVLPGHKLLLSGQGHKAIQYTVLGSLIAITILLVIVPVSFFTLEKIYPFIEKIMAWILIWISFFLLYHEKEKKTLSFVFFLMAGFLGLANSGLNISQPLLPLLTGLFGSSTLIYSLSKNTKVPEQSIEKIKLSKKELIKPTLTSAVISPFCSFFPGLGSSQAAIIGLSFFKNPTDKQFLILIGSINTLVMGFSFVTLYLINKTRTGIASAISEITTLNISQLNWILITIIITSIIATLITLKISKTFAKHSQKINYTLTSKFILLFLTTIVTIISGPLGLFVFLTSTILGLACISYGIKRSFLMGCLLIPTILYYLPLF